MLAWPSTLGAPACLTARPRDPDPAPPGGPALSSTLSPRSAESGPSASAASAPPAGRSAAAGTAAGTGAKRTQRPLNRPAPPVVVRQIRGRIVESEHRGHIVEADVDGRMVRVVGDPERLVALRSCVKPFGLVALLEAGGIPAFDLTPPEIALMASSHSGEDLHVRTLQGVFRRAGVSQTLLACGAEGMPLDSLTSARLARDGERPSPIRHMCSGQHAASLLLARMRGWPMETYWQEDHPAQVEYRLAVARCFGTTPDRLAPALDDCGLPTWAVTLRELARAYAFLAEPAAVLRTDPRAPVAPILQVIRDAMLDHAEMVAGTRERLDTSLMKGLPGALVSKGGQEGLRAVALLKVAPGKAGRNGASSRKATGLVVKIEDGSGHERAAWATAIEALAQAGVLDGQPLRMLSRYHRPVMVDPHGRMVAEAVADFELAPVGELSG
jgi:L-asparaginase II